MALSVSVAVTLMGVAYLVELADGVVPFAV
jgi:hypothetical protein